VTKVALLDANILYPSALRDLFVRIGIEGIARVHWTEKILDETFSNIIKNRPDLDPSKLQRTRNLMNSVLGGALIKDYEPLIEQLTLPDPDDRHVLAAAIIAEADVIVTKNLRDFPDERLSLMGIIAQHPDTFLSELCIEHIEALLTVITDIAAAWREPAANTAYVIEQLANEIPATAAKLHGYANIK
jgi:cytochrome P450